LGLVFYVGTILGLGLLASMYQPACWFLSYYFITGRNFMLEKMQLIQQVFHPRQGVLILESDLVEILEVNENYPSPLLIWYQNNRVNAC
jgi:hypothetical protein